MQDNCITAVYCFLGFFAVCIALFSVLRELNLLARPGKDRPDDKQPNNERPSDKHPSHGESEKE